MKAFHFKDPLSSKEKMLNRLTHWFVGAKFEAPVAEMKFSLADLCLQGGMQIGLYAGFKRNQHLNHALKSIRTRFGKTVVKKAVLSDDNVALPEESFHFVEF